MFKCRNAQQNVETDCLSLDVFQHMESVATVYLECREQTLEIEQLVAMTCERDMLQYVQLGNEPQE